MFPISVYLILLALPLFAFCDREVGNGERGYVTRGKGMAIAMVLGGLLGFLVLGKVFAVVGLLWAGWRSITFFNSSGTPQSGDQCVSAFLRQALMVPIALLAYWQGGDWLTFALFLLTAALVNTAMRMRYGVIVQEARREGRPLTSDFNATVEKVSGLAFGAALAGYALWDHAGLRLLGS